MARAKTLFCAAVLGGLMGFSTSRCTELFGQSATNAPAFATPPAQPPARKRNPLLDYKFTNELGQAVSLSDFPGQALGITFFFTRCPMPNFCPQLSKNFQEASRILSAGGGSFTNWHFISITFDPVFDTPEVLKAYAERYQDDPRHWSFLTGPPDKIKEVARRCGVKADPESGLINHNFRTLIIDRLGHLQMTSRWWAISRTPLSRKCERRARPR